MNFSKQLDWKAKQTDGYFMNYINGLTMISYIYLGVKIKIQHRLNFDPFFDFYNCLGYFLYIVIYGVFVLYSEPIIESAPTRIFLQVTLVNIVLIRLIWKSHTFRDRLLYIIRCNPRMFDLICWTLNYEVNKSRPLRASIKLKFRYSENLRRLHKFESIFHFFLRLLIIN